MKGDWRALTLVTQLGVTMAVSIVLSLILGLWIDSQFGTKPWATLVLAILGILGGSVAVYRMVADAISNAAEPGPPHIDQSGDSREKGKENE